MVEMSQHKNFGSFNLSNEGAEAAAVEMRSRGRIVQYEVGLH